MCVVGHVAYPIFGTEKKVNISKSSNLEITLRSGLSVDFSEWLRIGNGVMVGTNSLWLVEL